jgi:hypothetical protein
MNDTIKKIDLELRAALKIGAQDLAAGTLSDGNVASDLHAFYNVVGMKEGWLKPEYATPLSEQDKTTQAKNIMAVAQPIEFWVNAILYLAKPGMENEMLQGMARSVLYEANRGDSMLELAAAGQHETWKAFVAKYQGERVIPGYEQLKAPLTGLDAEKAAKFAKKFGDRIANAANAALAAGRFDQNVAVNPKLRVDNFVQFNEVYANLPQGEKDQDRLVIAVTTDRMLERALVGQYTRQIQ